MSGDPFRALGLAASADLGDDDVRAAWRRVAEATHPDRADGGDPAAFAAAANAYSELRTRFGRSEALADLSRARVRSGPGGAASRWAWRVRGGRPGRLALRVAVAVAVCAVAVAIAGWRPATLALVTGALTWLIRGVRRDLAAPAGPAGPRGASRDRGRWPPGAAGR